MGERDRNDNTLRPADLETFYTRILNSDAGQCADCTIAEEELIEIRSEIAKMKVSEGLHEDAALLLHEGFLLRGSPLRFVENLNSRMQRFRWLRGMPLKRRRPVVVVVAMGDQIC